VVAQAAEAVASPLLRNMGTIVGNLCQEVRCWYYKERKNYFNCLRKNPAGLCYALIGDNRYHSIFGAAGGCIAVNPSDIALALVALDASVVSSKRTIAMQDFFANTGKKTTVVDDDEIVTEIQVPEPKSGTKQAFLKFRIRKTIDFAISSVATAITIEAGTVTDARIVLGAVAPVPYRATAAEDALKGQAINESVAEAAGVAAVEDAQAMSKNAYLIPITKTLVKRAILA
jgi:xanthine dehydrogenase YagS FAD-binding subunit